MMVMTYRTGNADSGLQHNGVEAITFDETGIKALPNPLAEELGGTGVSSVPAFSAYVGSNQVVSNSTFTKVAANTELFDATNAYDTTLYRFTPQVAGYYQINIGWGVTAVATAIQLAVYKNGVLDNILAQTAGSTSTVSGSALFYANGTTDYFEFYVFLQTGETASGSKSLMFQACLLKGA